MAGAYAFRQQSGMEAQVNASPMMQLAKLRPTGGAAGAGGLLLQGSLTRLPPAAAIAALLLQGDAPGLTLTACSKAAMMSVS
jgi:hypothetical protein